MVQRSDGIHSKGHHKIQEENCKGRLRHYEI